MITEQDTKKRILATAFELFSTSSYDRVSVDDIAKKAGISKGGLFHHFGSKYDLGREALFWFAEDQMASLISVDPEKKGPEEQIADFIDLALRIMTGSNQMMRFFFDMYEEAICGEMDVDIWLDFFIRYVDHLEALFEQLNMPDPRMRAMLLLSTVDGFSMYYMLMDRAHEKIDVGALRKELVRMFLGGPIVK